MSSRFLRPWWIALYIIAIASIVRSIMLPPSFEMDTSYRLENGASLAGLYDVVDGGRLQTIRLKHAFKKDAATLATIQPGTYVFSWVYTPEEIISTLTEWPQQLYEHITLLEWRSIYDIDTHLVNKGYIEAGEYISFVTDPTIIGRYRERYGFLQRAFAERDVITTLEGYLYPDTYFVDADKDIIDQLVFLQLEGFYTKVREVHGDALLALTQSLQKKWYSFRLSSYGALVLASIIEKEERYGPNRPTIASVFFNRLETGMRIDADISLCYGLGKGYENCTPEVIVENLYDASNVYNTRAVAWLPPTPIVSPSASSVASVVQAEQSAAFFYLHDPEGNLHTAVDQTGHETNKRQYLR